MFSVLLSNKAEKQLRWLDSSMRSKISELFKALEETPVPAAQYDLKKIRGEQDTYRIRLSSFRVLYCVFWDEKVVRIAKLERRSETTYS